MESKRFTAENAENAERTIPSSRTRSRGSAGVPAVGYMGDRHGGRSYRIPAPDPDPDPGI